MNIIDDNKSKLLKYKLIPPNPSYIAGLLDGDGTIFIRKIKDGYQSGISLCQSRTNILQILGYHYGGTIIKPSVLYTDNTINEDGYYDEKNKRNSYTLMIRSNEYKYLLHDISEHIILKANQITCLLEIEKIVNKINCSEEKEELCNTCLNYNKIKTQEKYDYSKLNIEYIQGLYDAEGYMYVSYKKIDDKIRFSKGVYMKITQKNHPEIITEIQNFLGFGKTSEFIYFVDTFEDSLKLIKLLKPNLIVKYNQICAFEEYINTRLEKYEKYNEILHDKRESLYKIINMEKHQIEIYEDTCMEKDGLNIKIQESLIKEKYNKELHTKMIQSHKKTGINNPNYGHALSANHALNISIATTIAKRANNPNLTNEKIREIYALKDKLPIIEITEKYGLNRSAIAKIFQRKIIPTDDEDFLSKKMEFLSVSKEESSIPSNQKTSIGKRALSIKEYIEIICWKERQNAGELLDGKKIFAPIMAKYLTEKFGKQVSVDIVKNTWSGRTKLFDFEFQEGDISYEKYLEIIG